MAGAQGRGESRSPTGTGMSTPAKTSPRGSPSMEATLDLLTGLFPTSNPFGQEGVGVGRGIGSGGGGGGGRSGSTSNSPTTTTIQGGVGGDGNPNNFQDLTYESGALPQQQEPLDLLTGLFPPSLRTPSPVISPNPVNEWRAEMLGHSAFGGGGGGNELFGTPVIARNNPFLDNAVMPRSYSPPVQPIPLRLSEMGEMASRGRAGPMDGSFAKFPPINESTPSPDPGRRSPNGSSVGAPPSRVSRPQSAGSESSPTNSGSGLRMTGSLNFPQVKDSGSKSEAFVRHSSVPSGIGLEWIQNGLPRAESPRLISQSSNATPTRAAPSLAPSQNENIRRSSHETKHDQWAPSIAGTSRSIGKVSVAAESRTPIASTKAVIANDEFVGISGKGIYRAPLRGAIHPSRPVSLELRPHPLRGAPANQVTRLTCLEGSVWAACDLGLMVWDVEKATGQGNSGKGNIPGDDDAASSEFLRVQGSSAVCMVSDLANQVVWTGHRDGKMKLWPARAAPNGSGESRSASLVFQAHRHAVTALVVTPYGELWAGSESGELKAWPWEAVGKALSGAGDGASLMEKTYNDLRIGNVGVGPNGPLYPEIRFLVGAHAHGTVWCAGSQYIGIWDARTRERLKMFVGPNGLDLNSIDVGSPGKEILLDEDLKVGYAKVSSKKEKGGWLQRSRNAVLGAADAVRRAASGGGQGGDDSRRLEALVAASDGTIWGGYESGMLTQWDWEGRLKEVFRRPVGVKCMCVVGNRLWVGYSDGKLEVLSGDTGVRVGSWVAHRFAVVQMSLCGGYVFSLGLSGSIRGWNISSPDGTLDNILVATMSDGADSYTRQQHLRVLAGTWNTAQERASLQSTRTWLLAPAAEASVVIVGLQEVETGAGAIGMAAVKETVGMGLEKGSATGLLWLGLLDTVLGEGKEFERVGSRQLAGMLIGVWVRRKLLPYVGDVEVGAVSCGFGRAFGNKGAVGVKLMIFRRTICVLTSHLAAHMEHVSRRNADFEHIYNQMSFTRATRANAVVGNAASGVSSAVQSMLRGGNNSRRISGTSDPNFIERDAPMTLASDAGGEDAGIPELAEADLLIWTGDLNYRIDYLSYEEILSLINKRQWDSLLANDQLRHEMGSGRTFHGLREGPIRFQPTYKFDKWTTVYDTSEKKRIPAWCDRVLFRDSFGSANDFNDSSKQGLSRPCKASVVWYEACMEPEESDHKPVRCMLNVDLSVIDEANRRLKYGHIMSVDPQVQTCLAVSGYVPETVLSTKRLVLDNTAPSMLRLSNGDRQHQVLFVVHCTGLPSRGPCPCGQHSLSKVKGEDQYPRGGYGFPHWLQVVPASGVLGCCGSVSISVKMRPENHNIDQQDKVVVLMVNVKGILSSKYKQHMVCVSCGPSSRTLGKHKEVQRRRTQDVQGRPSSADRASLANKDLQIHVSRPKHGSSSCTQQHTPDLLL